MRAHDDALARERATQGRHEVRERLPHASAGLGDECAAVGERALDRTGERALLRAIFVTHERSRERPVTREHRLDHDRGGRLSLCWRCRLRCSFGPRAPYRVVRGVGEE